MRRAAVALTLVLAACGDSGGPAVVSLRDADALATQLTAAQHAVTTAPLSSLGSMAVHLYLAGIEVHSISPLDLGKTKTWDTTSRAFVTSTRAGAPANALRVILYAADLAGTPVVPLIEVGTVDLYPYNGLNGGPPDTTSLRYIVTSAGATPLVVGDFTAHSHYDPSCFCAIVEGFVTDGVTRADFAIPYSIIFNGPASFPGNFTFTPVLPRLRLDASLPAAGDSVFGASATVVSQGDTVKAIGAITERTIGQPFGSAGVTINGRAFATIAYSGGVASAAGADGHTLSATENDAVEALFALAFGIVRNVEWPTLVVFFCGC